MLIENEVNKLLRELSYTEQAQVHLNGFAVSVHMLEHGSRLALKTPVYYGGNYIPNSVRESLDKRVPFDRLDISTCLEIDEDDFSVWLTYKGECIPAGYRGIIDVLEDFSWLAEKWRDYLDEQDKNDLVYVPV